MLKWETFLNEFESSLEGISLENFWDEEYKNHTVYPERELIFNAFKLTPLEEVKVVIIGQDPYHEPNQAMGLAFSVPDGVKIPPSLVNIFKEINNDVGGETRKSGDLTYLAKQGVFLINSCLTVREGEPLSHHRKEYDVFMKKLMQFLDKLDKPIVFMLWGNSARKFKKSLANPQHFVLESVHPSPLGANRGGWFNQHQFSKANDFLLKNNLKAIDW